MAPSKRVQVFVSSVSHNIKVKYRNLNTNAQLKYVFCLEPGNDLDQRIMRLSPP